MALLAAGAYTITGGLGGLGLRTASLLVEGGAVGVVLSSRSGRMGGRALEVATSALKRVAACDIGDGADGVALLAFAPPTGVLHAAGAGDKGLLIELVAQRLHWMHASKAMGAWHLQCAAASAHLERLVLFSSCLLYTSPSPRD